MCDSALTIRPDTVPSIVIEDGNNEPGSSNNPILFQDEIDEHEPGSQFNPIVIVEDEKMTNKDCRSMPNSLNTTLCQ